MKLSQFVLRIHRVLGVFVGILLVVIALSGSALVFAPEIDAVLSPHIYTTTPQPQRVAMDTVLKTVQAAHSDRNLVDILLPKVPNGVYRIMADDYAFSIYANPYTGEISGARPWNQSYEGWLYELHSNLFAGQIGKWIVGSVGGMLLVLSVTGIILWPGWRRLIAGWKIRFHAPRPILNYDLHKVIGIVSVAFIVLVASTGVAIVFGLRFNKSLIG